MRIVSIILGFIIGSFMLLNGLYELLTDRYFGTYVIPRPWIDIIESFGINAFTFGPVFLVLGTAWLYFAYLLWHRKRKAYIIGLTVSILTLWHFPFGTFIAIVNVGLLRANKKPSGLLR